MRRIQEILLTEYIGAIAIGFLLAQTAGGAVGVVLQPVITYFEQRGRPQSIFAPTPSVFNWPQLIVGAVSVALHLLAAWLLLYWLYLRKRPQGVIADTAAIKDDTAPTGKSEEPS